LVLGRQGEVKVADNYKLSTPVTLRTGTDYSHEKMRTAQPSVCNILKTKTHTHTHAVENPIFCDFRLLGVEATSEIN
jgi:hypothetical protein